MCQPVVVRRRLQVGVHVLAQCALERNVQLQVRVRDGYMADEQVVGGVGEFTGWTREANLAGVGHHVVGGLGVSACRGRGGGGCR